MPVNKKAYSRWEVYAPEGPYCVHPKTGHPASYSICRVDEDGDHQDCLAIVFGKTEEQAAKRAKQILARVKGVL
jgi:hypothetical protein